MASVRVVSLEQNRLEFIAQRIQKSQERLAKGGQEWVDATLELAAALNEGRGAIPSNITFGGWLKERGLDFYNKDDRAALIGLASNLELAREILSKTESRCYQKIWNAHKRRFLTDKKTAKMPRNSKASHERAMNHRRMKLGDAVVEKIKGTSLDRADEMDELVVLNRGAPEGEQTEIVKQLVERAAAGEAVSAIAEGTKVGATRRKKPDLKQAWRKRMVAAWEQASRDEQASLIEDLLAHMKEQ